jgi:hypothetical protein
MKPCPVLPRNWMPPDGLDRSRPREVRLTAGGKGLLTLAAIFLVAGVVGAIGLGILTVREAEEHRLLREQGAEVQGVVMRLWRDSGESKQPWATYRFNAGGHTHYGRAKLRHSTWVRLSVGSPLPVRFVPSHPKINRPRGTEWKPMALWVPYLVGAGFAAFGWLATLPVQIQRRFLTEGRAAPGVVTRHEKTDKETTVHYEFLLLSGSTAKGHSGSGKAPPPVGSSICVLYHPENPRKSARYPFALVKLARAGYASKPRITSPLTSVSRKSRPWNLKVSRV